MAKKQKRERKHDGSDEQKDMKCLQFVAEDMGTSPEDMQAVTATLSDEFGSCYIAFEEAAINGEEAFEDIVISKELAEKIYEFFLLIRVQFLPVPAQGPSGKLIVVEDVIRNGPYLLFLFRLCRLALVGGISQDLQEGVDLLLNAVHRCAAKGLERAG